MELKNKLSDGEKEINNKLIKLSKMKEFRNLRADEIQVRPTNTKYKGSALLLLYKDARCDMNILDETVGPMNWCKKYYEVKGNLYCSVGIKGDNGEWVFKDDCGIESNTDAEKGEASDAFKRACFNWGLGRELYTTPKIAIKCPDSYYFNDKMNMTFRVLEIGYIGKTINELVIVDKFGNIAFDLNNNAQQPQIQLEQPRPQQNSGFQLQKRDNPTDANGRLSKLLYVDIVKSDSVERLQTIYGMYPELHQNQLFTGTLTKRKNELTQIS